MTNPNLWCGNIRGRGEDVDLSVPPQKKECADWGLAAAVFFLAVFSGITVSCLVLLVLVVRRIFA